MAKEITGTAVNLSVVESPDGKLVGMAEVVLVLNEPQYVMDARDGMVRRSSDTQLRFHASADALRALSKNLTAYADAADKFAKRVKIRSEQMAGSPE